MAIGAYLKTLRALRQLKQFKTAHAR